MHVPVTCDPLWPHGLQPTRLLCPWDFPGKNTGMGYYFLLQGILLTQGLNLWLLHWQAYSLPLHHLGSPREHLTTYCILKLKFQSHHGVYEWKELEWGAAQRVAGSMGFGTAQTCFGVPLDKSLNPSVHLFPYLYNGRKKHPPQKVTVQDLLYSTEKYTQYFPMNYNGREQKEYIYIDE